MVVYVGPPERKAPARAEKPPPAKAGLHVFYSPACAHCHALRRLLKRLRAKYPRLTVCEYNLADPENIGRLNEAYEAYEVPYERWGGTLAAFVEGGRAFMDYKTLASELEPEVQRLLSRKGPPARSVLSFGGADHPGPGPPAGVGLRPGSRAAATVLRTFQRFSLPAVFVAGLLDGLNPCAFATLIFLVSYLTSLGHSRRRLLAAGLSFAAGVFLAYLGIGLGLFRALQRWEGFAVASRLVYPLLGLLTLGLAMGSLADYRKARRGETRTLTLQLPRRLKQWSHAVVRRLAPRWEGQGSPSTEQGAPRRVSWARGPGPLAPGVVRHSPLTTHHSPLVSPLLTAFAAGAAITVLELFCTGQIYLPTLMAVWTLPGHRARALGYLLLYDGAFLLPLLGVLGLVYGGMGASRLAEFSRRHLAGTKLALALFFLGLTGYLAAVSVALGR